jgi:hypothetical protein
MNILRGTGFQTIYPKNSFYEKFIEGAFSREHFQGNIFGETLSISKAQYRGNSFEANFYGELFFEGAFSREVCPKELLSDTNNIILIIIAALFSTENEK